MDFSSRTLSVSPPPPQTTPVQLDPQKLVGARKRKPTNISKISSNSTSPQKSPLRFRDDEEENDNYLDHERNSVRNEPNNNKIQSILSELKFAKQRNKLDGDSGAAAAGNNKEGSKRPGVLSAVGGRSAVVAGGVGAGSKSPAPYHHVGGLLQEQQTQEKAYSNGNAVALRLPPPHSMMLLPAHVQPKQAHARTTAAVTSTLLQEEPLDLSVDAVDLSKNTDHHQNLIMMMMMGGGSAAGPTTGDNKPRFSSNRHSTLPSPPPSPPANVPMDLTSSSSTSPRVHTKYTDKVLMIGGKLDHVHPANHSLEFNNDKVSSSFGSPPSSIGSNQHSDSGGQQRTVRKYQKRGAAGAQKKNGGVAQQTVNPPGVKPKQRRYRTERPFHCPHCPARFTLRSNMERHGKHQHASVWQRSPSNRVLNKQRALQAQQQAQSGGSTPTQPPCAGVPQPQQQQPPHNVRLVLSQQLKRKLSNIEPADLASVETLLAKTGNEDFKKYLRIGKMYDEDEDEDDELDEDDLNTDEHERKDEDEDRIDEYDDERFREDFYEEDEVHEEDNRGKRNLRSRSRASAVHQSSTPVQTKSLSAYSSAPHKISCPHCTRKFPWTSSLRRHLLTHTGQKPFQCSHCPLLFTTKSNCDRHVARKHSSEGGAVTITLSDVGCGSNAILRGKLSEKKDLADELVVGEVEDDEDEEDDDYDGMVSKMGAGEEEEEDDEDERRKGKDAHDEEEEDEEEQGAGAEKDSKAGGVSGNNSNSGGGGGGGGGGGSSASFRCHLCELSSPIRSVILKHVETAHSDNYALLDVVGGTDQPTTTPPAGEEDNANATNRKVLCAFCIRRFWSVEDLRRHMRSHTGERPFSCDYCSRRFSLKHSLLRHMKKHEGNEPVDSAT